MSVDTVHSVIRSAKSFLAGTALSRIGGLFREIAMAASFGSCPEIAAFMVAYRLSNLFRRLLGEGNLQAGFVPHFSALKERGILFYRDTVASLSVILFLIVALLEAIFASVYWMASSDWAQIAQLAMWMTPGLFFIGLYGLNSALLQCRKKYFLPAVAPVAFNLIWIAAVLFVPDVCFLALAITAAFAGQWLVTAMEGWRLLSFKEWMRPQIFSSEFAILLKPLLLGIVGVSAVQFNSALDAIFARVADLEGPAFLWYAIRIQQLPFALFGVALSGALLPPLSRTEDPMQRHRLLQSALRHSAAFMLICTFGIFSLGPAGVNLLFGHGDFSSNGVWQTCACLWGYGLGLTPSVFVLLLTTRFYAEKNYRMPMIASLLSVVANIALNTLFVFGLGWGAISIAVATSLSSFLNAALLAKGAFPLSFCRFFVKMTFACFLPAAMTWALANGGMEHFPRSFSIQIMQFATLSAVYLGGLLAMMRLLHLTELLDFIRQKKAVNP